MATTNTNQEIELTAEQRQQLAEISKRTGVSWQELLSDFIARHGGTKTKSDDFSAERFDSELDSLLHSGPSLPDDFSRADIYADHD